MFFVLGSAFAYLILKSTENIMQSVGIENWAILSLISFI